MTGAHPPGGLRDLGLSGTYSTGDDPLCRFYLPALAVACQYDRMAGYYSSTVLRIAARGVVPFLENAQAHGGGMRLIVGSQLSSEDLVAVREGAQAREVVAEAVHRVPVNLSGDPTGDECLKLLGWMVREGLLQVKVGVPIDGHGNPLEPQQAWGYFHSKYGVLEDASGERVTFLGSDNETASGWLYNHETFSVAKSWLAEVWAEQGQSIVERFAGHWGDQPDPGWVVLDLPMIDDRLLKMVPRDYVPPRHDPVWQILKWKPPWLDNVGETPAIADKDIEDTAADDLVAAGDELERLARAPRESPFTAALTAPVQPLPHQTRVLHRAVTTFPRGYLFADEVGLGKTIEAGLVLRELLLSGQADSALLLVPASVMRQWQEELHEKLGLDVPRYTGSGFEDRHSKPILQPSNSNPWSAFPIVLASSHLARRRVRRTEILSAGEWDIVLVDEAHHARRRGSKPTDPPNSLLALLQAMKARGSWKTLYLASATPMQMNPHEAWDLIDLLGLPGAWGTSADAFLAYYRQLQLQHRERDWKLLHRMARDYFSDPQASKDQALERQAKAELGAVAARTITRLHQQTPAKETINTLTPTAEVLMDAWLRQHTPMRDRVFRNTRDTLRAYQAAGIIGPDVIIPVRHVDDEFIDLTKNEDELYKRIESYIRRHYNAYMSDKSTQALGFVMTVYRRRLTSSFYAIRRSLQRRLDVLDHGLNLGELLTADDEATLETTLFDVDELDTSLDRLRGEIHELRAFLADLGDMAGEDSKASQLVAHVAESLATYSSIVVFTQYTDTLDYVRERLLTAGYERIGCYSGRGGELWDPTTRKWQPASKSTIKTAFRDGTLHVLIGTDSMSEGLNLQTSGRLINYDVPWNLMRVEQRIGRIDRIGATYRDIRVTNYFYSGTVEEAVYKGIRDDYGDFTSVIGAAQPVLGAVEQTIQQLALSGTGSAQMEIGDDGRVSTSTEVASALRSIRVDIQRSQQQVIGAKDMGDLPVCQPQDRQRAYGESNAELVEPPPTLEPAVTMQEIKRVVINNPLTRDLLITVDGRPNVYAVSASGSAKGRVLATFDRAAYESDNELVWLSYGQPLFNHLLGIRSRQDPHG